MGKNQEQTSYFTTLRPYTSEATPDAGLYDRLNGFGSFRPRVVSGMSRFGRGSFRLGRFGLGCFGLILGWVVSAYFGGSFRPITPTPDPNII